MRAARFRQALVRQTLFGAGLALGLGLAMPASAQQRPYLLWLDGADLMLFTSASPGRGITHGEKLESAWWVEHINRAYASLFTTFVAHTNRVGFEDGLHFWGGATVFDPNGDLVAQGPYQEEAITVTELDLGQLHRTRARLPLLRDERHALVRREIERITAGNNGASDKG